MQDKLWLDDVNGPPDDSWLWVKSVDGAINALEENVRFDVMSLDHDLGHATKTGMDVVDWLIIQFTGGVNVWPHDVVVHSKNPSGRQRMEAAIVRYKP